jgi:hypothetical protein
MQLDDLLQRYFATTDLSGVAPDTFAAVIEHCRVDLGLEEDRGKRFALWSFPHMFESAPDLDLAFENEEDREAALGLRGYPGGIARRWGSLITAGSWHLQTRTRYPPGFLREQSLKQVS